MAVFTPSTELLSLQTEIKEAKDLLYLLGGAADGLKSVCEFTDSCSFSLPEEIKGLYLQNKLETERAYVETKKALYQRQKAFCTLSAKQAPKDLRSFVADVLKRSPELKVLVGYDHRDYGHFTQQFFWLWFYKADEDVFTACVAEGFAGASNWLPHFQVQYDCTELPRKRFHGYGLSDTAETIKERILHWAKTNAIGSGLDERH